MMDANQGMTVPDALELALAGRDIGIGWFEGPIDHRDWDGYASLRSGPGSPSRWASGVRPHAAARTGGAAGLDLWQPRSACAWAAWRRGATRPRTPARTASPCFRIITATTTCRCCARSLTARRRVVRLDRRNHRRAAAGRERLRVSAGGSGVGVSLPKPRCPRFEIGSDSNLQTRKPESDPNFRSGPDPCPARPTSGS